MNSNDLLLGELREFKRSAIQEMKLTRTKIDELGEKIEQNSLRFHAFKWRILRLNAGVNAILTVIAGLIYHHYHP